MKFRNLNAMAAVAIVMSFGTFVETAAAQEPVQTEPGSAVVAAAARIRDIVLKIDPSASFETNGAVFSVDDVSVTLVYDINADRMRLLSAIGDESAIDAAMMRRLMQANFDSALDARYAIAQGVLWSTFIHPLSTLDGADFGSGLGQTVNLVRSFGTSFSSGVLVFGGGDSNEELQELLKELESKSEEI